MPRLAFLALFAAWGVDAWLLRRLRLTATRRVPERLSLDRPAEVVLAVRNHAPWATAFRVADDLHPALTGTPPDRPTAVLARATAEVRWSVTPRVRGEHPLAAVHLRAEGPLGLAWRESTAEVPGTVRIYPDWTLIGRYEQLLLRGKTRMVGLRPVRAIGHGSEFENLRDYQPGDDPRHVDWKVSARRHRLTFRNHEPERQQDVLLLVDTGRLMTSRWKDRERLEASLQAAGMLAWVVTRSHDRVGMITFSDDVHDVIKPAGGARTVGRIREALLRTRADLTEPDYREAFAVARTILPKRALVLLFTDPVGTAMSGEVRSLFRELSRRHLCVLVSMRDPEVWRRADAPLDGDWLRDRPTGDALALRAAAESHVQEREAALAALRADGVMLVDAFPELLTPGVVNRYLEIKREQRL